jgi:hypothetical protein
VIALNKKMKKPGKKSSLLSPLAVIDGRWYYSHIYIKRNNLDRENKAIFVELVTKNGKSTPDDGKREIKFFIYSYLMIFAYGMNFAVYIIK